MNPYLIIAMLAGILAAGAGGFKLGADHEIAAQAREQKHITEAVEAANLSAAQAIAQIKPKYTTIKQEVQREIIENRVFTDCRLPADSLRLVNQALGAEPATDSKLPKANTPQ